MTPADAMSTATVGLTAAAVILGAAVLATTRDVRAALAVALDLLLCVGLLRLSSADSWTAIVTAAMVVAVRKIAASGLRVARRSIRLGRTEPDHRHGYRYR